MKRYIPYMAALAALLLLFMALSSFKKNGKADGEEVKDIDGNIYHTVKIGKQVWLVENLKVSKYQNGDPIKTFTDDLQWSNINEGCWCYYRNLPADNKVYGKLYNWFAITDKRGICPKGWHVATDADWKTLENYLGGESKAGGPLKATTVWDQPNGGATNTSGFTAMPGGVRNSYGIFYSLNSIGYFWSADEAVKGSAWFRRFMCYDTKIMRDYVAKNTGFSVRCVKD